MLERRAAINATEGAPKTFDSYSNGISDWSYESFDSWVRFDFDATTLSGGKLWAAARGYASKTACEGGPDGETDLMSNDPSIVPPLSAAELSYQCNGTKPPCKLHWYPGKNCYTVEDVPFASGTPGYLQRAKKLGYRTVAAASGTTANILQVIPAPSRVLGRISPISPPFFPGFRAFSPSRRGGSNKPQAGTHS